MGSERAAASLNCPMCGASAASDATRCEHCGARLATVACPSCFGLVFQGARFCAHCGAAVGRVEVGAAKANCPRCALGMSTIEIGSTSLLECPRCEGLWVDADSLRQICADREKQAAVLGAAQNLPESESMPLEQKIRYLPCPVCRKLMNRVNFAHCSHVVVDVCRAHGTWFDKDELRRIVEFIRAGGLEEAREKEIAELEQQRRELSAARTGAQGAPTLSASFDYGEKHTGISTVANLLKSLFE